MGLPFKISDFLISAGFLVEIAENNLALFCADKKSGMADS
jgi:hypothetical protein